MDKMNLKVTARWAQLPKQSVVYGSFAKRDGFI
jgi:hypothetical protein